jgi:hypothetical protein
MQAILDSSGPGFLPDMSQKTPETFSRMLQEADVAATPRSLNAELLVDQPEFTHNMKLWGLILGFRNSLHAGVGVKDVWKGLRARNVDLPSEGMYADLLWSTFLDIALKDESFAEEVLKYAEDQSERSNHRKQWLHMYDHLMLPILLSAPEAVAIKWHWRLFPVFQSCSWSKLYMEVIIRRPKFQNTLRTIHAKIKHAGIYKEIISGLCERGMYLAALKWHRHFLANEDIPNDTSAADPLITFVAKYHTIHQLGELYRSLKKAGARFVESSAVVAIKERRNTRDAMDLILKSDIFTPKVLGDEFWSAIFSTSFPLTHVFRYALLYGKGCIVGDKMLESSMEALGRGRGETISILQRTGLDLRLSHKYQTPPEMWPHQPPHSYSPLPPPMESLSASNSSEEIPPSHDPDYQNAKLQNYLKNNQLWAALRTIGILRKRGIILNPDSLFLLTHHLLRPRLPGFNPSTIDIEGHPFPPGKDVELVISLLLSLNRGGHEIPSRLWNELFKRLGMMGQLSELERLVKILVHVYSRSELPRAGRETPLRKIYGGTVVRALVEWGFLYHKKKTWGIRMVKVLRNMGVWIDERSIKRAVRVRLIRGAASTEIREPQDDEVVVSYSNASDDSRYGNVQWVEPQYVVEWDKAGDLMKQVEKVWGKPIWKGGVKQLRAELTRDVERISQQSWKKDQHWWGERKGRGPRDFF